MLRREPDGCIAVAQRLDQPDGKTGGIAPGHEGHAGRATDRAGGVVAGKAKSLAGEPIEVRRTIVRPAVAAQIAVPQVVGEYEEDVGTLHGRSRRKPAGPGDDGCGYRALEKFPAADSALHSSMLHVL